MNRVPVVIVSKALPQAASCLSSMAPAASSFQAPVVFDYMKSSEVKEILELQAAFRSSHARGLPEPQAASNEMWLS